MRTQQKILTGVLWGLTLLAMMIVIGAGLWHREHASDGTPGHVMNVEPTSDEGRLEVLGTVPAFSLVDENDKPLANDTLKGHPYIADFVYTRCPGPCPIMSGKMAAMQKSIPDARVHFLSVTIDPNYDKPVILKKYAAEYSADESRWHFATGGLKAVLALARGMLVAVEPAHAGQPIIHSQKFILVDAAGQIRGAYESGDATQMKQLVIDATKLAAQAPNSLK